MKHPKRAKVTLVRILRQFLAQGQETVVRRRLQGSGRQRESCIARAQVYLSQIRMSGDPQREWTRSCIDSVTSENRNTASSLRVNCTLRLRAIENLMLLAGYEVDVEQDATTAYIRSLVSPAKEIEPTEKPANAVEDALARYERGE